jgi:hypothetical protein
MKLISGFDVGNQKDFSALVVCDISEDKEYRVRHLQRWPLGGTYVPKVNDLVRIFSRPPLAGSTLAIDSTGVGLPVVHFLRDKGIQAHILPYWIGSGFHEGRSKGLITVPKTTLVSCAIGAFGHDKIHISTKLPLYKALMLELETYQMRATETGHETYGSETPHHDDLATALMLAVYAGTRRRMTAPLRSYAINRKKQHPGKAIFVAGADQTDQINLDADHTTAIITFLDDFPTIGKTKIIGRHKLECADTDPDEITTPWTEEAQETLFSPAQAKKLWAWLTEPDVRQWQNLVIVDQGGADRRALSLAMAICDALNLPRSCVIDVGEEEDTLIDDDPPNRHIYTTGKRGRYAIAV